MEAMSDTEDYNEFNCWDSGGAAAMLALVPAVLYYVFGGHDKVGAALMALVACGVGLFAFLVARFSDSRLVSRLMQLIGTVLCVLYWIYAIHLWRTWDRFSTDDAPQQETQQAS